MRRLTLLALALLVGGCEDHSYREIGADINVVTKRADALVAPAMDHLVGYGRRAIPQIETAFHTASPQGRNRLVTALARIGDPEAVPVLRHFALYDPRPEVRAACERVLESWAAKTSAAEQARAFIAQRRAAGEGPAPLPVGP